MQIQRHIIMPGGTFSWDFTSTAYSHGCSWFYTTMDQPLTIYNSLLKEGYDAVIKQASLRINITRLNTTQQASLTPFIIVGDSDLTMDALVNTNDGDYDLLLKTIVTGGNFAYRLYKTVYPIVRNNLASDDNICITTTLDLTDIFALIRKEHLADKGNKSIIRFGVLYSHQPSRDYVGSMKEPILRLEVEQREKVRKAF